MAYMLFLLHWLSHIFRTETFLTIANNKSFWWTNSIWRSFFNLNFWCWFSLIYMSITNFLHSLLWIKWTSKESLLSSWSCIRVALICLFNLSFVVSFKEFLLRLPNRKIRRSSNANLSLYSHLINCLMIVSCPTIFSNSRLLSHLVLNMSIRQISTSQGGPSSAVNNLILLSWECFSSYASIGITSLAFRL